jgi:hypothetical protein
VDLVGMVVTGVCALALGALIWPVRSAWRHGRRYAGLAALSLPVAGLALLAAIMAQGAGASHSATGRFLIGMGVGLAVGLAVGCAILLFAARRQAPA